MNLPTLQNFRHIAAAGLCALIDCPPGKLDQVHAEVSAFFARHPHLERTRDTGTFIAGLVIKRLEENAG